MVTVGASEGCKTGGLLTTLQLTRKSAGRRKIRALDGSLLGISPLSHDLLRPVRRTPKAAEATLATARFGRITVGELKDPS
jgi:hypothetical protein